MEKSKGNEMKYFFIATVVLLYIAAFLCGSPREIWEGMIGIVRTRDALITDYIAVAGAGACFFNTTGNNGMATGGSGDILCGMIGALAAFGLDCFTASANGVWLHGAAGDSAARKTGEAPMIARDILAAIGELFSEKWKEVVE